MRRSPEREGRSFMETAVEKREKGRRGRGEEAVVVDRDAIGKLELGLGGGAVYKRGEDVETVDAAAQSSEDDGAGGAYWNEEDEEGQAEEGD
ncbi:hypothetical protein IEQ34_000177 [Dendrobium chrysotoxum]|uniref:Uncharacterized protein n=1 Tax=Dendrobium chrysotoxum TaxID=161865 RepID=A0AAV7HQG1_DENCH|nr:hypothetical protein IEQ34_000177 [Dendrobium chrysotoxum]